MYPRLPAGLESQLTQISPTEIDDRGRYWPVSATTTEGNELPCVVVIDSASYQGIFGQVWPDQLKWLVVTPERLQNITACRLRLPQAMLERVALALDEVPMGAFGYDLLFADSQRWPVAVTHGPYDFTSLPPGRSPTEVVDVLPPTGLTLAHDTCAPMWCIVERLG